MKKRYMTLIVGVAALGVAAALWVGSPPGPAALAAAGSVRMPMIVNSRVAAAEARLRPIFPSATYSTRYVNFPAPAETVVAQIPGVGAILRPEAHITLIVSNGLARRHHPPKSSPAYYTGAGVYYASAFDSCNGSSARCTSEITVSAWADTDKKPNILRLIEKGTCIGWWYQTGDLTVDIQGFWYVETLVTIPANQNGCGGKESWRIAFSRT